MQRPDSISISLIEVGVITAAHGIRGQVKIRSFTSTPEDIFTYSPLTDQSGVKRYDITLEGQAGMQFIAGITGIKDRNAAELLKGVKLYARTEALPAISKENQWLYTDLKGLEARLLDGNVYGRVVGVYNFGAGDIIDIEFPDGKTEMLPFHKDFIGDVQVDEGYMIVFPPEYLEDDK